MQMYPEGRIHQGDGRGTGSLHTGTLQTFRAGGMGFMLEHDMEVWGWVTLGNNDCWPRDGHGGHPASLSIKLFPIARDGAGGLLQELRAARPHDEQQPGVTRTVPPPGRPAASAGGAVDEAQRDAAAADRVLFAAHARTLMQEELSALMQGGERSR